MAGLNHSKPAADSQGATRLRAVEKQETPGAAPNSVNWFAIVGLLIAYFLAGKCGLRFASIEPSVSAVWPPTGIALGSMEAKRRPHLPARK